MRAVTVGEEPNNTKLAKNTRTNTLRSSEELLTLDFQDSLF